MGNHPHGDQKTPALPSQIYFVTSKKSHLLLAKMACWKIILIITPRSLFLFPCLGLWRISLRTVAPWMSNEEFSSLMELRTTSPAKHQADGFVPPKTLGEYHGIPGRLIKSGTFFSGWVAVAWSLDHPTVHCRSRNLGVSSFVRGICILK